MSSELSTMIVVGPMKLSLSKRAAAKALKRAKEVQQEIRAALKEGSDIAFGDGGYYTDREGMEDVLALKPKVILNELRQLWNGGNTLTFSDVNARTAKVGTKFVRIVVAGDTSYGDEPEGDGFRVLLAAERLGMFPLLGLS